MGRTLSRKTKAISEIDIRIYDLMLSFLEADSDISTNAVLGYLRAAYVQGYTDCLKDDKKGQWITDLGYGVNNVDLPKS